MLVRRIRGNTRPWLPNSPRRLAWRSRARQSSSNAPAGNAHVSTTASPLAGLCADLDRISPRIDIDASQIEVLDGPKEFYETLKSKIRGAKRRIYLSTLYIGKSEHELISTIREALLHNGPDLKLSILTDALRGTRESPEASCASLLAPLVAEFPNRVEVRMYHTPNLTGFRKVLVPKRINEGWGLQHIKLYGIDDEVILSGANLSNDYFTNRQDRYHVFSSKRVADYFAQIHSTFCSLSCLLEPSPKPGGHDLTWPSTNPVPNPLEAPKHYIAAATFLLKPLLTPPSSQSPPQTSTSVYPLLCHPPTLNTELPAITTLLSRPLKSYTFTAGYFNPHPLITSSILAASGRGTILTAHPLANGFYGSKGISGMLPAAYSHLFLKFARLARGRSIQLCEWQRGMMGEKDGWTYHAKGLWVTLSHSGSSSSFTPIEERKEELGPSVTLIGSSNYTTRSYGLDLEVGAMVVTRDEGLRRRWRREEQGLLEWTTGVDERKLEGTERRAGWRVIIAMWIVRAVGGSL